MKFHHLAFFAIWLTSFLSAQEASSTSVPALTASIVGPIIDGTAPLPEAPKSGFTVKATDIQQNKTFHSDGRKIEVREISPIPLPLPPAIAPLIDINDPVSQERMGNYRENAGVGLLVVSSTIFRSENGSTRSLVHLWPEGKGEAVIFWSALDFSLLSGVSAISTADGNTRLLLMSWGFADVGRQHLSGTVNSSQHGDVEIPLLSENVTPFTFLKSPPSPEATAIIRGCHEILGGHHDELAAAFARRESLRLAGEAALPSPQQKPAIILNTWTLRSADIPVSGQAVPTGKDATR